MIFLTFSVGCASNPSASVPLAMPDCPHYADISDEEIAFLSQFCHDDMDVCPIKRETILKITYNHIESVQCIEQYHAVVESTHK